MATDRYDFIVSGLPGTGSCFWSFVLTDGPFSYCTHDRAGAPDLPLPRSQVKGDSSAQHLLDPVRADRRVYILRPIDDCVKSMVRRYPTENLRGVYELFEKMNAGIAQLVNRENTLFVDYVPQFDKSVIELIYTHCVGRQINPDRLNMLQTTNITRKE